MEMSYLQHSRHTVFVLKMRVIEYLMWLDLLSEVIGNRKLCWSVDM